MELYVCSDWLILCRVMPFDFRNHIICKYFTFWRIGICATSFVYYCSTCL